MEKKKERKGKSLFFLLSILPISFHFLTHTQWSGQLAWIEPALKGVQPFSFIGAQSGLLPLYPCINFFFASMQCWFSWWWHLASSPSPH